MPDTNAGLRKESIEVRDQLAEVVREAGRLALPKFRTPFKSWTKDKSSPVTEVDIAVNDLLRERLTAVAPDYAWLSEETIDDAARLSSRRVWIVDPIDGTRGFIAGLPDWTIVVALVEDGRPIAAVVFAPATDAMFTAALGAGTLLNGTPIATSGGGTIDGARVAGPKGTLARAAGLDGRMEVVPKIHSLALRLARVAEGSLDAAFASADSNDWDLAAADLLVHEAGGVLTSFEGQKLRYNRADTAHGALVAAGRERHARLVELIRGSRVERA